MPGSRPTWPTDALRAARTALDGLLQDPSRLDSIERFATLLTDRFKAGNKVLACGNGGSACDAMHFCEEFTGRYRQDRPPLPAIALTDPGHITCTANDYGFEHVFSRAVEAFGKPGDVLVLLSTSGNSANIVKAAESAKTKGLTTFALLGKDGGRLRGRCDHEILAPGDTADRIQELHMLILHAVIEGVERNLFPRNYA
jgi:D-sedoheptulose 7-phosphate isomerase